MPGTKFDELSSGQRIVKLRPFLRGEFPVSNSSRRRFEHCIGCCPLKKGPSSKTHRESERGADDDSESFYRFEISRFVTVLEAHKGRATGPQRSG